MGGGVLIYPGGLTCTCISRIKKNVSERQNKACLRN